MYFVDLNDYMPMYRSLGFDGRGREGFLVFFWGLFFLS